MQKSICKSSCYANLMQKTENHRVFYRLLANTLVAQTTNSFVWFALTFWIFLETKSVLITSYVAGGFALATLVSSLFFGTIVDHQRKKVAMVYSSLLSLAFYSAGGLLLTQMEPADLTTTSPILWGLICTLVAGSVAGNLRSIALATTVTLLFTQDRDKMNGLIGTVSGFSFAFTSVLSGLAIGFLNMEIALGIAIATTILALLHIITIPLVEPPPAPSTENTKIDVSGSIAAVRNTPGLISLIFFTTFNNFLGGIFMALLDAYGLSLVSVAAWGVILAGLSIGFMFGGLYIARFGLSANPVQRMLIVNAINWAVCLVFVVQPSIILLVLGMLVWMTLHPFIEATEQTIIQKVVPYERQGRVFGLAQGIESTATPVTAFLAGPLTQFWFIPFMTTGAGVALIGDWFGTGPDRGIALVFIAAGFVGLIVTLLAFRSQSYRLLSTQMTHPQ
jgi:MFS transporter, DHA3 family, multidrug efflux protein